MADGPIRIKTALPGPGPNRPREGLAIRPIMGSAVEDIFGFKTCCGARAFDQNLEIQLVNQGTRTLKIPSRCDLHFDQGRKNLDHLMPHGVLTIRPGEVKAFYCDLDPGLWARVRRLTFYDTDQNAYTHDVNVAT